MARRRGWRGPAISLAVLLAGSGALAQPAAPQVAVNVIPAPASAVAAADPAPVAITAGETIYVPRGDKAARAAAEELADLAQRTRGLALKVAEGAAPRQGPAISFTRRRDLADEAYALDVSGGQARISATGDGGLFYGAVTLWQLMTADPARGPVTLAAVRIDDQPRFAWRGLLLDSARHFQTPENVRQFIDWMALHKLNVLHWHLTDDQGWRLEIRKYPRLTSVGAWRTPIPGSADAAGGPRYGGFYTQAQVREIVAYAAARHVTIVPEIEMPGHAVSAQLAYPELGSGAPPTPEYQSLWGGFPYILKPDDRTLGVLEDILTEVMALFPGRFIHVGGDEAAKERWNAGPEAQARLAALGQTDPMAVQSEFTRKVAAFLEAHGRRLVGWDEILQGGELPGDAVVMSWHGVDGGMAAAAKGHDAVLSPAPLLYLDNRQGEGPAEPPGRGFLLRLRDVYAFNPTPPTVTPEAAKHLIGVQGNLWSEMIRTWPQLQAMAFPRAAAVAELGWDAPERHDWNAFEARLPAQFARYAALGVQADAAALTPRITATPDPAGARVTLAAQTPPAELRYTTDGSAPGPASPAYDQPFAAPLGADVRAAAFLGGARIGPVAALRLDPSAIRRRASQDLRLCNEKLSLNLEGPETGHAFLINPQDPCWLWPAADVTGARRVTVAWQRLPFVFGLDAAHNSVVVHPPRQPAGEVEVREDSCLTDPVAVAPLTPGPVGSRGEATIALPARAGAHDVCITFTGRTYDPVVALDWVRLSTVAAAP